MIANLTTIAKYLPLQLNGKIISLKLSRWTLHIPFFHLQTSVLSVSEHHCQLSRALVLVALLITLKQHSTVPVLAILLSQRDKKQRLVVLSFK